MTLTLKSCRKSSTAKTVPSSTFGENSFWNLIFFLKKKYLGNLHLPERLWVVDLRLALLAGDENDALAVDDHVWLRKVELLPQHLFLELLDGHGRRVEVDGELAAGANVAALARGLQLAGNHAKAAEVGLHGQVQLRRGEENIVF